MFDVPYSKFDIQGSTPTALSIASSDSGCGAGIQADLLTFAACGVFGTTAIAALTAQNPQSVSVCIDLDPAFLKAQIDQVISFFPVTAIKTGMLFSKPLIDEVVRCLRITQIPIVVDPVMIASNGVSLLQQDAVDILIEKLLPLATIITPNLDEVEVIMGVRPQSADAMAYAAIQMAAKFNTAVLLKGGHLNGDGLVDVLAHPDGNTTELHAQRIYNVNTHGSGCTLSSAIAAFLAKGHQLNQAVQHGHHYLQQTIRRHLSIKDQAYLNHFGNE